MNPSRVTKALTVLSVALIVFSTWLSMRNQVTPSVTIDYDASINQMTVFNEGNQSFFPVETLIINDQRFSVDQHWLSDNMQKLSTTGARKAFLQGEKVLYSAIHQETVLIDSQGQKYELTFRPRTLGEYSVSFWLHRCFAALLMFFSLWVFYLSPKAKGALLAIVGSYGLGIGYLIATSSADRLWAVNPAFLEWNFIFARFLVVVFAASVFALSWYLPFELSRRKSFYYLPHFVFFVLLTLLFIGYTDAIQNVNFTFIYPYTLVILFALILLLIKAIQSLADRERHLLDWISLRWVLTSAAIGVFFPVIYNVLWDFGIVKSMNPVLANSPVIIFKLGLSALVVRDKLYRFESLWWKVWWVVIGMTSFISIVFITHIINIPVNVEGYIAIAFIATLLGFSISQFMKNKYFINVSEIIESLTRQLTSLKASQREKISSEWQAILRFAFKPTKIRQEKEALITSREQPVAISKEGNGLCVANIDSNGEVELIGASQSMRLFTDRDIKLGLFLHHFASANISHQKAQQMGEEKERKRIAADLHDDIGGKLLYLSTENGKYGEYARETLDDLRTLTRGLNSEERTMEELVADLVYSIAERCEAANVELSTNVDLGTLAEEHVTAQNATMLTAILSECCRNGLQHTSVSAMSIAIVEQDATLHVQVINDGAPTDPQEWRSGLGLVSMQRRVNDTNGCIQWSANPEGGAIVTIQWPSTEWSSLTS